MKSQHDIISLFVDAEIVAALIKANGEYTNCGTQVKAMMSAHFETGKSMFKDELIVSANELYQEEVLAQL